MKFFDQIDPGSLDRRIWQLWVLALTIILVLATGLAIMMYAVLFSRPGGLPERLFVTLFTGYCVLIPLLVGYLFDRQLVIKQLHRKIAEEQSHVRSLEREVKTNALETLPGVAHFQDRLSMEYRRAFRSEQPVSLVVVGVRPSLGQNGSGDMVAASGEAAKALTRKLRGEDSIYHFGKGVFAILLPRVPTTVANQVVDRLEEGMHDAAGPECRFVFETRITNFPDHALSAREMEKAVADFLTERGGEPLPGHLAAAAIAA
jgi:GGDEF domain-containing protein